jgi:hypothetical protein
MRRILSISLLLVMSLSLVAPLFASIPESSLPMCCRRSGAHHCMGTTGTVGADGKRVMLMGARCPSAPKAFAVAGGQAWTPGPEQSVVAVVVAHPAGRAQTEARYRISFGRSRQKRGPPSYFL